MLFFRLSCGIFLENRLTCFMKFCKDTLGFTVAITQKIIWHVVFILQGYFELCWVKFLHLLGHNFCISGRSFYVK